MSNVTQGENDFVNKQDFLHSDYFGSSVSISNDGMHLAIGTRNKVYTYEMQRDRVIGSYEWNQLGEYVSVSDGIDLYGTVVHMAGENKTMVVSIPQKKIARVLQLNKSWEQIGGDLINIAPFDSGLSISDNGEVVAGFMNHSLHVFSLNQENEWIELDNQENDENVTIDITLNNLTIAALNHLEDRYIYSIEGLLVKHGAFSLEHPCTPGLRSRWKLIDLSNCNQTELDYNTNSSIYNLLIESNDKNEYIRDIQFPTGESKCNASDIESEIEIEVQGSCWKRVHDEHLSIFDVSYILYLSTRQFDSTIPKN